MKYTVASVCLLLCLSSFATGQTFDLNVTCPVISDCQCCGPGFSVQAANGTSDDCVCGEVTVDHVATQPRLITTREMLSDQNQLMEDQFAQMTEAQQEFLTFLENHQSTMNSEIADLKKSISSEMNQNRLSVQAMVKKSTSRDVEVMEKINQSSAATKNLSKDLISIAEKSINNSQAIIQVIQASEEKFAKFQQHVRSSLKSMGRKTNGSESIVKKMDENLDRTEQMFEALEKDLEEIRQRISKIERDDIKHQKQLQGKLKLLDGLKAKLDPEAKIKTAQTQAGQIREAKSEYEQMKRERVNIKTCDSCSYHLANANPG